MRTADTFGAIVMGLSPTGLYAIRELAEAGVPVLGLSRQWQCGCTSRSLTHAERVWRIRTGEELLARLLDLARRDRTQYILIPCDDWSIEFITAHCGVLGGHFLFQGSYSTPSCSDIIDKSAFYRLCERARIPYPPIYCGRPQALLEQMDEISFPIIIKPTLIHKLSGFLRGKKVLIARTRDEMVGFLRSIPDTQQDWILQEVIPGPESQLVMAAGYRSQAGRMCQVLTARKLRQFPPGFGNASLVRTEPVDVVADLTEKLLDVCGFHGIFASEFKYDARDGHYKILEINPRPSLWFNVARCAGKRIAYAAFCDLTGGNLPEETEQQDGVYWRYALKDIYSQMFYRFRGDDFVLPRPAAAPGIRRTDTCWAVYDPDDRMPAAAEVSNYILKMWGRMSWLRSRHG